MDETILGAHGVDHAKGVARCMNDEDFYERLLEMFLQDDSFQRATEAYARGDAAELFRCVHELKGVSGNAAMTELYAVVCPLVELLRGGGEISAEVERLFAEVEAKYLRAAEGVSLALGR